MTAQQERDIRAILDGIAREHEGDGSGNMHIRHIADWLRSARPEEQELMRDVLLDDFKSALPRGIDWIALDALAVDGAPRVASALEKLARSAEGRLEWRDSIIWELATMGHRPALDLYLEALKAGRDFKGDYCLLRVHLIKVDLELALEYGTQYLVEGFSQPRDLWARAASCAQSFLHVYRRVDPRYVLALVRRVTGVSAEAGQRALSAMVEDCKFYLSLPPFAGDTAMLALQKELESLRREIESGTPHEEDQPNA